MRFVALLLVLATTISTRAIAQDQSPEEALGQSLVHAIVSKDIVAYSQCWISTRRMLAIMKQLDGPGIPADKLRQYHARRNKRIAESFTKIQKLIDETKIDPKAIRLKSCKAVAVREQKGPKGALTLANAFEIVLTVGNAEMRFEIDDGVMHNGLWYFMDSPINLFAGDRILSFRDGEEVKEK